MDKDNAYKTDNEISKKDIKKNGEEKLSYNKIIDEIDYQKSNIKNIDNLKESFLSINKSFGKLLDLLSLSIKGPAINSSIEEISSNNMATIAEVCDKLDLDKEEAKNRLNDLYYKKDNFARNNEEDFKRVKEENKDKEEKEEE